MKNSILLSCLLVEVLYMLYISLLYSHYFSILYLNAPFMKKNLIIRINTIFHQTWSFIWFINISLLSWTYSAGRLFMIGLFCWFQLVSAAGKYFVVVLFLLGSCYFTWGCFSRVCTDRCSSEQHVLQTQKMILASLTHNNLSSNHCSFLGTPSAPPPKAFLTLRSILDFSLTLLKLMY